MRNIDEWPVVVSLSQFSEAVPEPREGVSRASEAASAGYEERVKMLTDWPGPGGVTPAN